MPKITTEFKRPGNHSAIILHYGDLKYYTGESGIEGKLSKATEMRIERMKDAIESIAAEHRIAEKPLTKEFLKEYLDKKFRPEKGADSSLPAKMLVIIEKMKEGKILTPRTKKKYSPGTLKGLKHTVVLLKEFDPKLQAVDLKTYEKFISFCHEKNFSTNYIGGQIKNWKTLGKAVGGNPVYDHEDFKIISEVNNEIYLTMEEIKLIHDVKISPALSVARDWFIVDYFTGLRVSDLTTLGKINLTKGTIVISNEKTDDTVVIPIHPYVKAILKKYKGFPPKIADQSLNDNIKVIAKKAGVKGTVLFTITKGGKRKDDYYHKWEMISNHTARRSFITNLLKQGLPESVVMKLTGIKSYATIHRYNKMSSTEAAEIASKHKFFTQ